MNISDIIVYLSEISCTGGGGGGGGRGRDMSIFEPESLAIFAGNTQKYSLINYSKIAQKVLNI